MGLTRQEAIEGHRAHFKWLAEKCRKILFAEGRSFYFTENNLPRCKDDSYCCQYALENSRYTDKDGNPVKDCGICPIDWEGAGYKGCPVLGYDYYLDEEEIGNYDIAAECAMRVANVPMKEEES